MTVLIIYVSLVAFFEVVIVIAGSSQSFRECNSPRGSTTSATDPLVFFDGEYTLLQKSSIPPHIS